MLISIFAETVLAVVIANTNPDLKETEVTSKIEEVLNHQVQEWDDLPFMIELKEKRARKARKKRSEPQPVIYTQPAPIVAPAPSPPPVRVVGELMGSVGYALPYGNCVNQVPVGLRGPGNPISWPATTQTPYIGAAALWHFNHTGRVVGIWSNGDIEIAHENAGGWGQSRFPRSAFRGFR